MNNGIINRLESALGETIALLSSFAEKELNTIPYEGSWTAGQVGRHLYKAESGMDGLLSAPAGLADRDPGERIKGLETIFMDFSTKMKSPDFIIPEEKEYDKDELIRSLQEVKDKMIPAAEVADLVQMAPLPEGHPMNGNTKLEMVHFMTYHTLRHNHQLQKIRAAIK